MKPIGEYGDKYELSTGKILEPNCGFFGINANLEIVEGYDNPLRSDQYKLTRDEWIELAGYMISLWQQIVSEA